MRERELVPRHCRQWPSSAFDSKATSAVKSLSSTAASGVNLADRPTGRPRALSRARRAALHLWGHTMLPRSKMARVLGLSPSDPSQLLETTHDRDPELTSIVAKATQLLGCGEPVEQLWLP